MQDGGSDLATYHPRHETEVQLDIPALDAITSHDVLTFAFGGMTGTALCPSRDPLVR